MQNTMTEVEKAFAAEIDAVFKKYGLVLVPHFEQMLKIMPMPVNTNTVAGPDGVAEGQVPTATPATEGEVAPKEEGIPSPLQPADFAGPDQATA